MTHHRLASACAVREKLASFVADFFLPINSVASLFKTDRQTDKLLQCLRGLLAAAFLHVADGACPHPGTPGSRPLQLRHPARIQTSHLFFRIILAFLVPSHFHIHFRRVCHVFPSGVTPRLGTGLGCLGPLRRPPWCSAFSVLGARSPRWQCWGWSPSWEGPPARPVLVGHQRSRCGLHVALTTPNAVTWEGLPHKPVGGTAESTRDCRGSTLGRGRRAQTSLRSSALGASQHPHCAHGLI